MATVARVDAPPPWMMRAIVEPMARTVLSERAFEVLRFRYAMVL